MNLVIIWWHSLFLFYHNISLKVEVWASSFSVFMIGYDLLLVSGACNSAGYKFLRDWELPWCSCNYAADLWRQIIGSPRLDDHIKKPDLLSFYIASKLPVSDSRRQELLEIDGISYRLRREIQILESFNLIHCKNCLVRGSFEALIFF